MPLGDSEIIEIANRGVWQTLSMQESENFKRLLVDAHKSSRSLQVEGSAKRRELAGCHLTVNGCTQMLQIATAV